MPSTTEGKLIGVLVLVVAILGLVATIFYYKGEYAKAKGELSTLQEKYSKLERELETEKKSNQILASEASADKERYNTMKKLYEDADKIHSLQIEENRKLKAKVTDLQRSLPKPVGKEKASKETDEEFQNSTLRIKLIWAIYCEAEPDDTACQEVLAEPKPDSEAATTPAVTNKEVEHEPAH